MEDGNLYIYTTEGVPLINLNVFPSELNLFEADSAWRISPWVAVVEDVLQRQLEYAQIILRLHGYEHVSVPKEVIESFFLEGDAQKLVQILAVPELELIQAAPMKGSEET